VDIQMETGNDNFPSESAFLLEKAEEIISKKCDHGNPANTECGLLTGGACPLLLSAMSTIRTLKAS